MMKTIGGSNQKNFIKTNFNDNGGKILPINFTSVTAGLSD